MPLHMGSMYALRVLRAHGLQGKDLWQVCEATTVSYLTYASPAWWGYADANSRQRLQSVLNKLKKHGFLPHEFPSHEELCEQMCRGLFNQVLNNKFHVLHQLLPPEREMPYSLRPRAHNRTIPIAHNSAFKKNFMIAMLYQNCY